MIDKGCGMSYATLYMADKTQEEIEKYNDRFFWNEGEITLSRTKMPISQEEIDHANEVIAKVTNKYFYNSSTTYK